MIVIKTVYRELILLLNKRGFTLYSKLSFFEIIYNKMIQTILFFNETPATFSTRAWIIMNYESFLI